MAEYSFANDATASRYTLHDGDDLVSVLDYRDNGEVIALTRAFTVPTFRGHGHAAVIVERAVADIEARADRKVSPVCWYVADWFRDHPDHHDLLIDEG